MGTLNKLNKPTIDTALRAGKEKLLGDGGGLYLKVTAAGTASWIFRYRDRSTKKLRSPGLGSYPEISIADARKLAGERRELLARGIDPIAHRKVAKARADIQAEMTFRQCAEGFIESFETSWRNPITKENYERQLKHTYPIFGHLPVQEIDRKLILKVLEPLWRSRARFANELRRLIERVLDWAKAKDYRAGQNPAKWEGEIEHHLPSPSKIWKVKHHNAMDFNEVPRFMAELAQRPGNVARALEFLIVTNVRAGTVTGARWDEIDFANRVWSIPGARMKSGHDHRVPLSGPAIALLKVMEEVCTVGHHTARRREIIAAIEALPTLSERKIAEIVGVSFAYVNKIKQELAALGDNSSQKSEFVFPSSHSGMRRMSQDVFIQDCLEPMGLGGKVTAHGFRSSFRDWAAEKTDFSYDACEIQLAHKVGNKTERAYRRGDMLEKRREIAEVWAEFCYNYTGPADVIPLFKRSA
jgi:integrase